MPRPKPPKLPKHVRLHSSGKYRAVLTLDGKRRPGPLRATPELAADDADEMLRARREAPARLWTLRDGLDEMERELHATGARAATIDYYRYHSGVLLRAWDETTPLHAITPEDVRTYIRVRSEAGVSVQTIWGKELQVLHRVFSLALERRALASTPFAQLRRPRLRSKRFDWLPLDVASRLLERIRAWPNARCAMRDADIITVALLTGARRAELGRLRPADVDMDAGRIHIEGKNRNRFVPIADAMRPALERLLAKAGALLLGDDELIASILQRWKRRLHEPRLVARAMRHGFATEAAADVSQFELQQLMGHASPMQSSRYYHARDSRSLAAVNSLGKRLAARSQPAVPTEPNPADGSPSSP